MEKLIGTVEEIIYQNHDNGYTVCEIRNDQSFHTAVGYIPYLAEGETVIFTGTWTQHSSYGPQFKVEKYEKKQPDDKESLMRYLASGIVKGIGPATAEKIVDEFEMETINVLENEPHKLAKIKGITHEKAILISNLFREQREIRNAAIFLQDFGISPMFAAKIYKIFGKNTVEEIKENPYKLADEIIGIGFKKADRIALGLGLEGASKQRLGSGIKYILNKASQNGNTFLPREKLIERTADLLNVNENHVEDSIISLVMSDDIVDESMSSDSQRGIYLKTLYQYEINICRKLAYLNDGKLKEQKGTNEDIDEFEKKEDIKLSEEQRLAIIAAVQESVTIITGGPGTGKTTIIKAIIEILHKRGMKIELAAPTGRATKKMAETTSYDARTIHRLLEIGYMDEGKELTFNKNEENPLETDIIIIDEMSMVDTILMSHLLKAVMPGTSLVMIGDIDQLPSVGPGNVLKSLIECEKIKSVRLKYIFRQAGESNIITNAHKINSGEMPIYNELENDFFLIKRNNTQTILSTLIDVCVNRLPLKYNVNPIDDIQVLSPARKSELGVINLNIELQKALNPESPNKKEKKYRNYIFRVGDKVMQIRNNYSMKWHLENHPLLTGEGVYNGDMGRIIDINEETEEIEVRFDDEKIVVYQFDGLDELEPSYAITVHKSQGSEFKIVIIPIFNAPSMLLSRNILYTSITRAKDLVVLIGFENTLKYMVENDREDIRYTGLLEKLKQIL